MNSVSMLKGNTNSRRLFIDISKTIGLFLMVLGHGGLFGSQNIEQVIYSFHMPLFFILSGLFFRPGKLKRTVRSTLIPYLSLNALMLIWSMLLALFRHESILILFKRSVPAIIMGLGYNTTDYTPVCAPMWFFYVLMLVHVIANFAYSSYGRKIFVNSYLLVTSVLSIFVVLLLKKSEIDTLIPIDSALYAFPYFAFGYYIKEGTEKVPSVL